VRPVAVPIEVLGIQGRELASLDMPCTEYTTASTWQPTTWQPTSETAIADADSHQRGARPALGRFFAITTW
jgi:hypothetical protein